MLLYHTADIHIDANRAARTQADGQNAAFDSAQRVWDWICQQVVEDRAEAFVISGDLFLNGHPSPEAVGRIADGIRFIKKHSPATETVILPGNHDRSRLRASHRTSLDAFGELAVVVNTPTLLRLECGLQVGVVPWTAQHDVPVDFVEGESLDRQVAQFVQDEIWRLADLLDDDAPAVLAGHLTVSTAKINSGKRGSERDLASLMSEPDVDISVFDDGSVWDYGALGHIHLRQEVAPNVWYPGSPERIDFSEATTPKSVNVVEFTDTETIVEHVDTPARELRVIRTSDSSTLGDVPAGATVRIVVDDGRTEPDRALVESLEASGVTVFDWRFTINDPSRRIDNESLDGSFDFHEVSPSDALDIWWKESGISDAQLRKEVSDRLNGYLS